MNDLVGQSRPIDLDDAEEDDGDEDWLDLGDENEDAQIKVETRRAEERGRDEDQSEPEVWVDPKQFERMVDLYVERLTSSDEPLGAPVH
jgi:hypothetical protein